MKVWEAIAGAGCLIGACAATVAAAVILFGGAYLVVRAVVGA